MNRNETEGVWRATKSFDAKGKLNPAAWQLPPAIGCAEKCRVRLFHHGITVVEKTGILIYTDHH
jgi:hypothetical protein